MSEHTYTLIRLPNGLWECDTCGALVVRCSIHTDWHLKEHYHITSPTGQTGGPCT